MHKTKKFMALGLVLVMGFSLVACGKKPIDPDDFEEIMEDMDYLVYESEGGKKVDEYWYAYDEDNEYNVSLTIYDDKDDAKDEFEDMLEDIEDAKEDEDFEGTIKKSGMGNYKKVVINGENDGDEAYMVVIRSDNMILLVMASDNGKSDVKEVNKILKELGY